MIISRTPLRISFTGGGSDLPVFYRKRIGAVVSTSINKYVYVTVNKKFDSWIRVAYSKNEEVPLLDRVEHPLVREAMRFVGINKGVEITTVADIPSKGTGLGSSSAFTVGLLHVLNTYLGRQTSKQQLAKDCCHVELNLCAEPIGKQDQYATAIGGFNLIEFHPDDSVLVYPLEVDKKTIDQIKSNLIMFYTGITRSASSLLREQTAAIAKTEAKLSIISEMVKLTYTLRNELQRGNANSFGEILHENWILKRKLSDLISTEEIDSWYDSAIKSGALGGKILGAGAGGFLLLYAPEDRHEALKTTLPKLKHIEIDFDSYGTEIILNTQSIKND